MNKGKKLTPSLPKGFKDRWGKEIILKNKIINSIKEVFINYNFGQLETPEFEYSSNIGSYLAEDQNNLMSDVFSFSNDKEALTLRYDLSAPLSRFVAENFRELVFPYKRFALGNVFRQEKSDSARYRSFAQLDADIIGDANTSQVDAEIINIINDSYLNIGLKSEQFKINISNKKIILGLLDELKIDKNKQYSVLKSIDKLDRLGAKGVKELLEKGRLDQSGAYFGGCELSSDQSSSILSFLNFKDIKDLKTNLSNDLSIEGINEIEDLFETIYISKNLDNVVLDVTKQRGLSYYSGFLVETNLNFKIKNSKGKEIAIGSTTSGGRYDNLISKFKGADYKGSGVSFGIDRILYGLNQLNEIEVENKKSVLVCILDPNYIKKYYEIVNELRNKNIPTEIYLDKSKNLKKQLQYADRKKIDLAIICGENEFKDNKITIKYLQGEIGENSKLISKENLINEVKKYI